MDTQSQKSELENMKNNQKKMKNTINDMKNTLEGSDSRLYRGTISKLKDRTVETSDTGQKKRRIKRNEDSLRDL